MRLNSHTQNSTANRSDLGSFECDTCGQVFFEFTSYFGMTYDEYLKDKTSGRLRPVTCDDCIENDFNFNYRDSLDDKTF